MLASMCICAIVSTEPTGTSGRNTAIHRSLSRTCKVEEAEDPTLPGQKKTKQDETK